MDNVYSVEIPMPCQALFCSDKCLKRLFLANDDNKKALGKHRKCSPLIDIKLDQPIPTVQAS